MPLHENAGKPTCHSPPNNDGKSRPPFRWVPANFMRGRQELSGSEILPFLGELVVVVVVVIEKIMQFGHEQLDIYRVSPEYAARESWAQ
ncbi:MAG: hypothetical protein JRK53_16570 [Deltaproteobacteria bacterium]|nr:hypothetical protein [Deltaproteobacteria bacterium]